jgi:hypothetical protein
MFQGLQVLPERLMAAVADHARHAAVHHGLLARVQADAGARVDELSDPLEIGGVELELRPLGRRGG